MPLPIRAAATTIDHAQARALYATQGFSECAPYYHNPIPGTVYMALWLQRPGDN